MLDAEKEIKTIRVNAMKNLANALNKEITDKYELMKDEVSISMFGSQTILSDFDMHFFLKNHVLKNESGEDKIKDIEEDINLFIKKHFNASFDKAIETYLSKVELEKSIKKLPDHILNFFKEYNIHSNKGLCDFYVGSLEDLIDHEEIPIGVPNEKEDYRRGYRGNCKNVKMKFIAKTNKHLSGFDVSEYIEKGASKTSIHPSEGYEKYLIETRNIAYGFLHEDSRSISKSLVEIAHAIYILSGEGILSEHEDKLHMGERILGHFLTSPHYRQIINDSLDVKRGLDKDLNIKKDFDWKKLKEKVQLEDGRESNVTGIDCLWNMFDYLSRLFKKTVYESGYIVDDELKININNYLSQTSSGLIKTLCGFKKTGEKIDNRFLLFYFDEIINNGSELMITDEMKDILEDLSSSLKKDTLTDILTNARIKLYLGDYASAKEEFENLICGNKIQELIKQNPWDLNYSYKDLEPDIIISNVYKEYGAALSGLRQNEEAKDYILKAIELNPLNPELWDSLKNIKKCLGEIEHLDEYETLVAQLKKSDYNVFEIQKLKSEEIKNLFKFWKENFDKTTNEQLDMNKKDYEKTLSSTLSAYNKLQGRHGYAECYARMKQLDIISDFIDKSITPLVILNDLNEQINPLSTVDYILFKKQEQKNVTPGAFPLYKKATDLFFKQKRTKESRLMELDFSISSIKKDEANKKYSITRIHENPKTIIEQYLTQGFIYISGFETCLEAYKKENLSQNKLDDIQERYDVIDEEIKNELMHIRQDLEKQVGLYEMLNVNLIEKNKDAYVINCGNCNKPIVSIWNNCPKCKSNPGLKKIEFKKENLTELVNINKNDFILNEDATLKIKESMGYPQIYLKELPEPIKERIIYEGTIFGLMDVIYTPKENSPKLKNKYAEMNDPEKSLGVEKKDRALYRACIRSIKLGSGDKTEDCYVLYLNQKFPEFNEISSVQLNFSGHAKGE